jgi:hypothetical protein
VLPRIFDAISLHEAKEYFNALVIGSKVQFLKRLSSVVERMIFWQDELRRELALIGDQ